MKKFLLLLMTVALASQLSAQFFEGFEENCYNLSNPFYSSVDCYDQWVNITGSPQIRHSNEIPGMQAIEGDHFVHAHLRKTICDGPGSGTTAGTNPNSFKGDGMALQYNFVQGQKYILKFQIRYGGAAGLWKLDCVLANGLTEQTGHGTACNPGGDVIPDIPAGSQVELVPGGWPNNSDWIERTMHITAQADYDFLWFRGISTSTFNLDFQTDYYLDAVEIIDCSQQTAPDFYTVDEDGNITSSFCYGEDVTVCVGKADYDWTRTLFTVYKEPAGSFFTKTGTRFDVQTGCYNLSEFIRERGNKLFEPGYQYEVRMSVYAPGCGWFQTVKPIWVDCCEEENADFDIEISGDDPDTKLLTATAIRNYTYLGDQQQFCLSADSDNDGVYELVDCWNDASFKTDIDPCIPYQITHAINTLCGSDTITQNVNTQGDCDECEILDLSCSFNAGGVSYQWQGSPDAEQYEIEIVYDDNDCACNSSPFEFTERFMTDVTFRFFSGTPCFSFRVRAICEDGREGEWSEKLCSNDCIPKIHDPNDDGDIKRKSSATKEISSELYPNPFDDFVTIRFYNALESNAQYKIVDITGKVVLQGQILDEFTRINTASLRPGTYFISMGDEKGNHRVDKLIKI